MGACSFVPRVLFSGTDLLGGVVFLCEELVCMFFF